MKKLIIICGVLGCFNGSQVDAKLEPWHGDYENANRACEMRYRALSDFPKSFLNENYIIPFVEIDLDLGLNKITEQQQREIAQYKKMHDCLRLIQKGSTEELLKIEDFDYNIRVNDGESLLLGSIKDRIAPTTVEFLLGKGARFYDSTEE